METRLEPIIDIHSHVLPGVDDGARDMGIAVQMMDAAYQQGVRILIATPHHDQDSGNQTELLKSGLEELKQEAKKIGEDLELFLGNEVYFEDGCVSELKDGRICTMAGSRYVLVEFSTSEDFNRIYSGMKDLILDGYCPIIAHAERYSSVHVDRKRIRRLIDLGCYIQVNAESCLGGIFDRESKMIRQLIEEGYVHFIASDMHNMSERKCRLKECRNLLEKKMSRDKINQLFYFNPKKILENKYI